MDPLFYVSRGKSGEGDTGKRDYRNLLRNYGGLEALFIGSYFTGAVRNEKASCKALI
jgi:hypothetical protein